MESPEPEGTPETAVAASSSVLPGSSNDSLSTANMSASSTSIYGPSSGTRSARSAHARTAALVASLVLVFAVVMNLLGTLSMVLTMSLQRGAEAMYLLGPILIPSQIAQVFLSQLPFAIGVFLCLWLLAPLTRELSLGSVLLRGLAAGAVGAVMIFTVQFAAAFLVSFDVSGGRVFGWLHSILSTFGGALNNTFAFALSSAMTSFLAYVPIVLLAAVILWVRMRDRAPESTASEAPAAV